MYIEPFGKIDIGNLAEYYDGIIKIHGKSVEVDLNFESSSIEAIELKRIEEFIYDIDKLATQAFDEISRDFDLGENSKTVKFYLQHHLEQFSDEETIKIFGTKDIDKQTYFSALFIRRIGVYPEDNESYAVFDIQLPEEYTNYLLAVTFNNSGELSYLSMES